MSTDIVTVRTAKLKLSLIADGAGPAVKLGVQCTVKSQSNSVILLAKLPLVWNYLQHLAGKEENTCPIRQNKAITHTQPPPRGVA